MSNILLRPVAGPSKCSERPAHYVIRWPEYACYLSLVFY